MSESETPTFYITEIGPKNEEGDQHFTLHWYVTDGLGYAKEKAGWRAQHYLTHLEEFKDRTRRKGHTVIEGEHP